MEFMTAKEAAEKWNVSVRLIQRYCAQGRICGARKNGTAWEIPSDAEKPQKYKKSTGGLQQSAFSESHAAYEYTVSSG